MKKIKLKNPLALTLVLVVLILSGIIIFQQVQKDDNYQSSGILHTVNLTENGFSPSEIKINAGDTIKFTTSRSKPFWPASNLHPTHTLYPEFDPKEPIPADKSWSFKFTKEGVWRFHDHLSPFFTGTITVGHVDQKRSADCKNLSNEDQINCWDELMTSVTKTQGIDAGFEKLAQLYDSEPEFAKNCHGFVHKLGEAAYTRFSTKQDFKITTKASYCNFGFYHGFMTTLLAKTGDLKLARQFCDYVDNQLGKQSKDAVFQCFHGIGHGAVGTDDTRLWGNEQAMIQPALKLCNDLFKAQDQLYRCTSGIYNGIANFYLKGDYKLTINKNDPLWVCRDQPKEDQNACFGNMTSVALSLASDDLIKATKYIENITDSDISASTMEYLADDYAGRKVSQGSQESAIPLCLSLQSKFQNPCILGYARGIIEHGKPGQEYVETFKFCGSNKLSAEYKHLCFGETLDYFVNLYSPDKYSDVCKYAKDQYGQECRV